MDFSCRRSHPRDLSCDNRLTKHSSPFLLSAMSAAFSNFDAFHTEMRNFCAFGSATTVVDKSTATGTITTYINEFWTAKQRAAHSLHEVSYRACFKPQLPRFFIERFTRPGDVVYDPFMGRGTTLLEAALLGRQPAGCDINPLSAILCLPRMQAVEMQAIQARLAEIDLQKKVELREDLLVFYHPDTLQEVCALREYFLQREQAGQLDEVDGWIRMVATNRLTGHSAGFFSVYSLPPNQAVSIASQTRINAKRQQVPPYRHTKSIIAKKSQSLLKDLTPEEKQQLRQVHRRAQCLTGSCDNTPALANDSVSLVVTSPPFLDVVQYDQDNWLRCWFNGIDSKAISIWQLRHAAAWQEAMTGVLRELRRILVPGGIVAFEVGEVKNGKLLLEDLVVPAALAAGLTPMALMINAQEFTKTSNCWGIDNASKGTNTNRIAILQKTRAAEQLSLF